MLPSIASSQKLVDENANLIAPIDEFAVYLMDPAGMITSWESGMTTMKGYAACEVVGKHFSMFQVNADRDLSLNALREAKVCGKFVLEGWRERKDHSKFYACATILPLFDPHGNHIGYINITKNLTSQREALDRLQNELMQRTEVALTYQRRLRAIADTLPSLVFEVDTGLRFRFANVSCQKFFSKHESELIGRCIQDQISADIYQEILPHLDVALRGKLISVEKDIYAAGIKRTYMIDYVPEFGDENVVQGLIIVATDVTQIKEAKIAAESASLAKSSFLANIAHEIRTPLGAVLGFSELLLKPDLNAQDRKVYQSAIARNGSLLSNIVNDVLDFAKIEAGVFEIDRRDASTIDILSDTLAALEFQANTKNIRLKTTIDSDTPQIIYTDPSRLKQILFNIVGNAIKFTDSGSVFIHVAPTTNGTGIRFVVEDSGIGISPDQASKLFTPFKQSEDFARRRFSGTGLGLALSKQMAERLGGDVELTKTELGKGSVFTISIDCGAKPRSLVETIAQSKPNPSRSNNSDATEFELRGARILLVEDSPDNQILVSRILQSAGAIVVSAYNGVEALSQSADNKFDLIVMDLQMPIMDGYQAAQALRSRGDTTPIIALTAHAMREESDRCFAVGINAHLAKPINTGKLVSTLAQEYHRLHH